MTSWTIVLPLLSFLLIGVCWVVSSPPNAGPDETSHYVRMVGMAHGGIIGGKVPADTPLGGLTGDQLARVQEEGGVFDVPGNLTPYFHCTVLTADQPFTCEMPEVFATTQHDISWHGKTLPAAYVLPAVVSMGQSTSWRTLALGRLGFLLQDAALFAVALLALRRCRLHARPASLAMLALSATPLLAFESGTLAPNGTETLAVVAFVCALVAAVRARSSRWLWIAAAVGSVACWARDLGALQVLLFGVAVLATDRSGWRWLWGRRRTRDVAAAGILAAAGLGSVIWQLTLKAALHPAVESPSRGWADLGRVVDLLRHSIGLLGWLNIPIDRTAEALWIVAWVVGVVVLFRSAARPTQRVVVALGVGYVVLNLYLISAVRNAGFDDQARFTLAFPIVAVVLLVVGQPPRLAVPTWRRQWPFIGACAIVAIGHFSGLLMAAYRTANGLTGGPMDFSRAAWVPPGGWNAVIVLFVVACGSLLLLPVGVVVGARRTEVGCVDEPVERPADVLDRVP